MSACDVVVVGGCGHVGLPLGLALAGAGLRVVAYDLDDGAVTTVRSGQMPFEEREGLARLRAALADAQFDATSDPGVVDSAEYILVVIGTPVDEHLNPDIQAVPRAIADLLPHLHDGQIIILRSTIYPGVTRLVEEYLSREGLDIEVAFCPERIAEGKAFEELYSLPQIVSARRDTAMARARKLFEHLTPKIVETSPEEAELAKLFTNTWRYIKFAAVNQFFMIANDYQLDFERIRHAITYEYPRAMDMPGAGFAAGPCLFKDTMQLAAFNNNQFVLGHASMLVNEGLPLYLVARLEQTHDLRSMTVGILGMAFKAGSDDIRSSLSYKLRRLLRYKAGQVVCHDPRVTTDPDLLPMAEVLDRADLLIIGAPHEEYLSLRTEKPVVDIWNLLGHGTRV
jgi:UDP-N-acetyl-D-mannosaminuronic acid dehydrogenase